MNDSSPPARGKDASSEPQVSAPVPCAKCGYDLAGQTHPHCPECGAQWRSFDEMEAASRSARRLFVGVLRWRLRIAYIYAAAFQLPWLSYFVIIAMSAIIGPSPADAPGPIGGAIGPEDGALLVARLLAGVGFTLGGGLAMLMLLRVVYLRLNFHLPADQRRELNGSLPLLVFEVLPLPIGVTLLVFLL